MMSQEPIAVTACFINSFWPRIGVALYFFMPRLKQYDTTDQHFEAAMSTLLTHQVLLLMNTV